MTRVLLVAAADPARDVLQAALAELGPAGVTVDLALARDRTATVRGLPLRRLHVMKRPAAGLRSGLPRAAASPRWWRSLARVGASQVVNRRGDLALRTWYAARWDPWVARAVREADVIAALDRHSVYAVWRLARRNRRAVVLHGLDAALRASRPGSAPGLASAGQETAREAAVTPQG